MTWRDLITVHAPRARMLEHRSELYLRVYAAAVQQGTQNPHLVAKEALAHFDEEFGAQPAPGELDRAEFERAFYSTPTHGLEMLDAGTRSIVMQMLWRKRHHLRALLKA